MRLLILTCILVSSSYAGLLKVNNFQSIVERVNSLQTTWKAENHFGPDVTIASFKKSLGVSETLNHNLKLKASNDYYFDLPEEFDAREKWPNCPSIGHIRDQGICGSCWAVSAAAVMSDRLCIASNGTITDYLSDEELLSCCPDCSIGCRSGQPEKAWEYFQYHGLVTGGDYGSNKGCQPYSIQACEHYPFEGPLPSCSSIEMSEKPECKKRCTNPTYKKSFSSDHYKAKEVYTLPSLEKFIRKDIMTNGPVQATFWMYEDFPTYKSGVYKHVEGELLGRHAVRLLGWGTENGVPYWLAANQWNSRWGDKGFFKILRGHNECTIDIGTIAGIVQV